KDDEVNPFEKLCGALRCRASAFFRSLRAQRGNQQKQERSSKQLGTTASLHRASLAGRFGRGGTCKMRRTISSESCKTVASTSRTAARSSSAIPAFASAT